MQPRPSRTDHLVTVLSLSFVLGMAVGLGVYFLWGARAGELSLWLTVATIAICPPFILSVSVGSVPGYDLSLVLLVGTIAFANAFLYAGVAAGLYAVVSHLVKPKRADH